MSSPAKKSGTPMIGAGIGAGIGLAMVVARGVSSFPLRVLIGAACGGFVGGVVVAISAWLERRRSR